MFARRFFAADRRQFGEAMSLFADGIAPALRQLDGSGGRARMLERQPAMGARTDASIIAIAPVDQIVTALLTGAGMVGDFIGRQAGIFRELLRGFVKTGRKIIVRNPKLTAFVQKGVGRFRLD